MEEELQGKYLGYLDSIKQLLDDIKAGKLEDIPEQELAKLDERYAAAEKAFKEGIGAYQDYVDTGASTMAEGIESIGTGKDYLSQAADIYANLGTAPTREQLDPFINPYQQALQDEINRAYDIEAQKASDAAIAAGAFGGGREGIQRAELGRNRVGALAQAQGQAFEKGLQNYLASQSAAAGGLGNIASQFGTFGTQLGQLGSGQAGLGFDVQRAGLTDIGTMLDFANLQQNQAQKQLDIDYANQLAKYQKPFTELGFLGSAFGYAPQIPQYSTAGGGGSVSPLRQMLGYGAAGLGALSSLSGLF